MASEAERAAGEGVARVARVGRVAVGRRGAMPRTRAGVAELAAVGLIVLAAAALRFYGLGDRQLFRDEAASWLTASYPIGDLLHHVWTETYPPLYLLALRGWIAPFGDGEASLRALSAVAGLLAVAVTWLWAREALGRSGGLLAGAVVAASQLAVANSRDARMYAIETLFAALAWWLVWRATANAAEQTEQTEPTEQTAAKGAFALSHAAALVVLAAAVAGEVWTLALGLPVAALQLGYVLVLCVRGPRRPLLAPAVAIVAGIATLVPWMPALVSRAAAPDVFWTPVPDLQALVATISVRFFAEPNAFDPPAAAAILGPVLAVIGIAALVRAGPGTHAGARPDARLALALAAGMALVPAVWIYSQLHPIYDPRYLGAALPPFAVAVAVGVLALGRAIGTATGSAGIRRGSVAALSAVLVGSMVVTSVLWVQGSLTESGLAPARQTAARLTQLVRPGDVVVAADARTYFSLAYEWRGGVAARLGVRLCDWEGPHQPFYRGSSLLDPAVIVHPAGLDSPAAFPGLAPGGTIWLTRLAPADGDDLAAYGSATGKLVETGRFEVPGNAAGGEIVALRWGG